MLSKNNRQELVRKENATKQRFAIKKLTVGVTSVLVGLTFLGVNNSAHADTTNTDSNSQNIDESTAHQALQDSTVALTSHNSQSTQANDSQSKDVAQPAANNTTVDTTSTDTSSTQSFTPQSNSAAIPATMLKQSAQQTNGVAQVSSFADFSKAFVNKDVSEISFDQDVDMSTLQEHGLIGFRSEDSDIKGGLYTGGNGGYFNNTGLGKYELGAGQVAAGNPSQFNGIARKLVINGNGHTLNMGKWFISLFKQNYTDGHTWDITFKNIKIISNCASSTGAVTTARANTFLNFTNVGETNAHNTKVTFDGVTATLDSPLLGNVQTLNSGDGVIDVPLVNAYFAGINNIDITLRDLFSVGHTISDMSFNGMYAYNLEIKDNATVNLNVQNPKYTSSYAFLGLQDEQHNVIKMSKDTGQGNVTIGDNATLNINTGLQSPQYGYRAIASRNPDSKVTIGKNSLVKMNLGKGSSQAIMMGNLTIGEGSTLDIQTQEDNDKGNAWGNGKSSSDGYHYAPITLGTFDGNGTGNHDLLIDKNATLRIVRDDEETITPLISYGSWSSNSGKQYRVIVNEGGTLDLQDGSYGTPSLYTNAATKVYGPVKEVAANGLITMFGINAVNSIVFNNPKYINLQRTGKNVKYGDLIREEGLNANQILINQQNAKIMPIAQWDRNNKTATPDHSWIIKQLSTQASGGDYFSNFLPQGTQIGTKGGTYFDGSGFLKKQYFGLQFGQSNGSVTLSDSQGVKRTSYDNGYVTVNGRKVTSGDYGLNALGDFMNSFSWWSPQRISFGTGLFADDNPGKITFKYDADHEPEVKTIYARITQKLTDLKVKDGIKDVVDQNNQVVPDWENQIDWNKTTWGIPTKDETGMTDQEKAVYEAAQALVKKTMPKVDQNGNLMKGNYQYTATVYYQDGSFDIVAIPVVVTDDAHVYTAKYQLVNGYTYEDQTASDQFKQKVDNYNTTLKQLVKFYMNSTGQETDPLDGITYQKYSKQMPANFKSGWQYASLNPDGSITYLPALSKVAAGDYYLPIEITYPDKSLGYVLAKLHLEKVTPAHIGVNQGTNTDANQHPYVDVDIDFKGKAQLTKQDLIDAVNGQLDPKATTLLYTVGQQTEQLTDFTDVKANMKDAQGVVNQIKPNLLLTALFTFGANSQPVKQGLLKANTTVEVPLTVNLLADQPTTSPAPVDGQPKSQPVTSEKPADSESGSQAVTNAKPAASTESNVVTSTPAAPTTPASSDGSVSQPTASSTSNVSQPAASSADNGTSVATSTADHSGQAVTNAKPAASTESNAVTSTPAAPTMPASSTSNVSQPVASSADNGTSVATSTADHSGQVVTSAKPAASTEGNAATSTPAAPATPASTSNSASQPATSSAVSGTSAATSTADHSSQVVTNAKPAASTEGSAVASTPTGTTSSASRPAASSTLGESNTETSMADNGSGKASQVTPSTQLVANKETSAADSALNETDTTVSTVTSENSMTPQSDGQPVASVKSAEDVESSAATSTSAALATPASTTSSASQPAASSADSGTSVATSTADHSSQVVTSAKPAASTEGSAATSTPATPATPASTSNSASQSAVSSTFSETSVATSAANSSQADTSVKPAESAESSAVTSASTSTAPAAPVSTGNNVSQSVASSALSKPSSAMSPVDSVSSSNVQSGRSASKSQNSLSTEPRSLAVYPDYTNLQSSNKEIPLLSNTVDAVTDHGSTQQSLPQTGESNSNAAIALGISGILTLFGVKVLDKKQMK